MKKYFAVKENSTGTTHLKCEVYYSLGGYNCFTCKSEGRGYYASVTPVERSTSYGFSSERYVAFTGIKQLVKPVSRRSAKDEADAEKLAEPVFDRLIEYVLNKQGLELNLVPVASREAVETVA